MSAITIDRNVPLPHTRRGEGGRRPKYPWKDMQVGDSFVVTRKKGARVVMQQNSIRLCARAIGYKVATRVSGNDLRVWRVK